MNVLITAEKKTLYYARSDSRSEFAIFRKDGTRLFSHSQHVIPGKLVALYMGALVSPTLGKLMAQLILYHLKCKLECVALNTHEFATPCTR